MAEDTVASFPAYADLTQRQGWAPAAAEPVSSQLDDAALVVLEGPRYTEGTLLGAGGMGKVMLARDARIGREVAVKQLRTDRELTREERARFLREARVQGQLEHPSIVPVYDIDRHPDGTTFFTMRRVLGRTLHAILEEVRTGVRRSTQRELLSAFATVCLTIDYAHSRGVIHRDIKPANIMLGDFGEVYVLDWGLARFLDESESARVEQGANRLSMTGEMMGTPLYMAPEQMADPRVGVAADVFSLGAILFEILTLQRLRDATNLYLPAEARPSVRAPHMNVAPELETICVKATESDPKDRYPSARALQEAVAAFLEGDRDLERRRELARVRADHAKQVLAKANEFTGADADARFERERTVALRELGRAVALDPANEDYGRAFAQIWSTPPRATPRAVKQELVEAEQAVVRSGAKSAVVAGLTWFAFIPLVMWMGVRRWDEIAYILVPNTISIVLAAIAGWRMRFIPPWIQMGVVLCTLAGMTAVSRSFGPLVLMPLMVTVYVIVMQAHPARWFRRATWVIGPIALVTPLLLEVVGVLPASYVFADGRMQIVPQLHELPEHGSMVMLAVAYVASLLVPGIFIGRMRVALTAAQEELHKKEWHYKRLGGELISTAAHDDRLATAA